MRSLVAGILLLVGALLVPVSTAAWWLRTDVVSTSGYVDTVTPLATDPAIVAALEKQLVAQTMQAIDSSGAVDRIDQALGNSNLPPALQQRLRGLRGNAEAQVRILVTRAVGVVVENPEFAVAWAAANKAAHQQLIAVLSGDSSAVVVRPDSTVDVRLGELSSAIKSELEKAGVPFASALPEVQATLPVGDAQGLHRARVAYTALDRWWPALPVVTVVLIALGLLLAPRRRRALRWTSLVALLGLGATFLALLVGRAIYLHRLPPTMSVDAARAFYDTVTAGLRQDLLWVGLGAAVVLVLALLLPRPGSKAP